MVARCFWGISLQVVERTVMVGSSWCWLGDGGAVLLGNECLCRFPLVARCFWGISLQVVKRTVMVGSRWRWLGDGGTVLLGNAFAGFHWWRGVFGESHCRWSNAL